jgi:hypothetical protein
MRMRNRSLPVHAINVAENEMKNECRHAVSNHRLMPWDDPIYARIGQIRPLGHHGPLSPNIIGFCLFLSKRLYINYELQRRERRFFLQCYIKAWRVEYISGTQGKSSKICYIIYGWDLSSRSEMLSSVFNWTPVISNFPVYLLQKKNK